MVRPSFLQDPFWGGSRPNGAEEACGVMCATNLAHLPTHNNRNSAEIGALRALRIDRLPAVRAGRRHLGALLISGTVTVAHVAIYSWNDPPASPLFSPPPRAIPPTHPCLPSVRDERELIIGNWHSMPPYGCTSSLFLYVGCLRRLVVLRP